MSGRMMAQMMSGAAFAGLLAGCAATGPEPEQPRATPVRSASAPASKVDAIYSSAVGAIERRDYVRALDLLQVARREDAGDVRVLNALGVVYDKLGRFDLSRRYYAEAAKADPASPVVRANIAYSERLQAQASGRALPAEAPVIQVAPPAEAPAAPEGPVRVVAEAAPAKALAGGPERMGPPSLAELAVRVLAAIDVSPAEAASPPSGAGRDLRAVADPAAVGVVERVSLASPTGVDRPFARVADVSSPAPADAEPLQLQPLAEPRRLDAAVEAAPAMRRVKLTARPAAGHVQTAEPPEQQRDVRDREGLIHRVLAGLGLRDRRDDPPPTVSAGAAQPVRFDLAGLEAEPPQRLEPPEPAWPWLTPRMTTLRPASIELAVADTPVPPQAPARTAFAPEPPPAASPPLRLATPTSEPRLGAPAWPGVRIIDATGRFARGEPLRASLADLGWTAPRSAMRPGPRQAETVIYYPSNRAAVAKALARTLPGFVRLVGCDAPCGGLQLVIGEDARAWAPMPGPSHRGAKGRTA